MIMVKYYAIVCVLLCTALHGGDLGIICDQDYGHEDVFVCDASLRGYDHVAKVYDVRPLDSDAPSSHASRQAYADQLETALYKAIDAMDERGMHDLCRLISESSFIKIAKLPVTQHFEQALTRALRGKSCKGALLALTSAGLASGGLRLIHKPVSQIHMPAVLVSGPLLVGAVGFALVAESELFRGLGGERQTLLNRAQNMLRELLSNETLIIGGDERAIKGVLARILKKLN